MKKKTLLLLLFPALFACEKPLFDTHVRDVPDSVRTNPPLSARDTTAKTEPSVFATAFVFPDSVDWRSGDMREGKLVLFQNGKALGSLPAGERPDPASHCFADGHLWTFTTDGASTTVSRDGGEFFSFPGQESLAGLLVSGGHVHTLGQHPGGGFCYRVDGEEVFSSAQGMVLGASAGQEALLQDGADVCYTYALPVQGADDQTLWEYRVMRGARILKTIPPLTGVRIYDILVHKGVVYRLENRYGDFCLMKGEEPVPLPLPLTCRSLHLTLCDGEVRIKGFHHKGVEHYGWIRDPETVYYEYHARWRHIYDILSEEGECCVIVQDYDDYVVKVIRDTMEVTFPFVTYRLHTPRCVAYRNGMVALALIGDQADTENMIIINDRQISVPFNGYFTGIYIE